MLLWIIETIFALTAWPQLRRDEDIAPYNRMYNINAFYMLQSIHVAFYLEPAVTENCLLLIHSVADIMKFDKIL